MPLGSRPQCSACKVTISCMWRKDAYGVVVCNSCYLNHINSYLREDLNSNNSDSDSVLSSSNSNGFRGSVVALKNSDVGLTAKDMAAAYVRKSSRIKQAKSKSQPAKSSLGKGKNRRYIFKKTAPIKSHSSFATIVTATSVFYNGFYYQIGDIVSLVDYSGDVYYAQIKALLQDQYCEKSAIISWLLPTSSSQLDNFDPTTYFLGPTEELPRKLEYMNFVCHAPADYYKPKHVAIPGLHSEPSDSGFIWTSIGPKICRNPSTYEIFGLNVTDLNSTTGDTSIADLEDF